MLAEDSYWFVAGNTTQVWSSARATYVPTTDTVYLAWLAAGHETIDVVSEDELSATLNDIGLGHLAPIDLTIPGRNYNALIRRRAEALARAGDQVGALVLLHTIGE
jgi:subtilisin family serine protease